MRSCLQARSLRSITREPSVEEMRVNAPATRAAPSVAIVIGRGSYDGFWSEAYKRGYQQVFVEDACSARAAEDHAFVFRTVFPRIGRVRQADEVMRALGRPMSS